MKPRCSRCSSGASLSGTSGAEGVKELLLANADPNFIDDAGLVPIAYASARPLEVERQGWCTRVAWASAVKA